MHPSLMRVGSVRFLAGSYICVVLMRFFAVEGTLENSVSSNNDRIETYCNIFDSLQQDFRNAIRVDKHHIVERMGT